MKVDIWSDVRCPFCYIGKRRFEDALAQFPQKDKVEVEWHSFELDPSFKTDTTMDVHTYLAKAKGQSREWSVQMHGHVLQMAREAGLDYDFDKMVMANSFNAHRLIQLAKAKNLGDAAEEALFKALFTDGKNIDDNNTLIAIGREIGIDAQEVTAMLAGDAYTKEVRDDEAIAGRIGIGGVPFFVLDNKYGISGAQAPETFLQALQQSWAGYEQPHPQVITAADGGDMCDADGACSI